jgi:hypothetical protein
MIGLVVRIKGGGVVADLEYEHMVRILLRHRDVERMAAGSCTEAGPVLL